MGKDNEMSIIIAARERQAMHEQEKELSIRLKRLFDTHGKVGLLGGPESAKVSKNRVFGEIEGTSFCVEIRGNASYGDGHYALEFGSGEFHKTFVYRWFDWSVWDASMDKNRGKGEWLGSPPADLRRNMTSTDLVQLREAMDLFEQNVGKGVNRD